MRLLNAAWDVNISLGPLCALLGNSKLISSWRNVKSFWMRRHSSESNWNQFKKRSISFCDNTNFKKNTCLWSCTNDDSRRENKGDSDPWCCPVLSPASHQLNTSPWRFDEINLHRRGCVSPSHCSSQSKKLILKCVCVLRIDLLGAETAETQHNLVV